MHHAATGDLQPVLPHLLHERTGKIDFKTWLGIAEVVRAKTDLHVVSHQLLENKFNGSFQIADSNAFVDVKSFDLLKGRIVSGVGVVTSINPARHDDAHGWLLFFHHANLNRGSVSAKEEF